ncbi:VOC family protein [uncultured Roseovarius sp.]|uniref:VOC family protein n=1 Tax=uncultured Roseovarius sp. TaxID=293344 RepID=UPI0026137E59|nr:VOC family protein [uncultured Roseovarius sp.]
MSQVHLKPADGKYAEFHAGHPSEMPTYVASSELIVRDLQAMAAWYEDVIGLEYTNGNVGQIKMGIAGEPLLTLTQDVEAELAPKSAPGLFHNAFVVPSRAALARWFAHVVDSKITLSGASNHLVSEAIYLDDPEGNGIEVYRDTPRSEWTFDDNDFVQMASLPMDLDRLYAEGKGQPWSGMEAGTSLGHIHLKVSSNSDINAFAQDLLGFDLMLGYTSAWFYATGGYHHHISANEWHSKGQPARDDSMTGLKSYTLQFNDRSLLDQVAARLPDSGYTYSIGDDEIVVRDPSGIDVRLV